MKRFLSRIMLALAATACCGAVLAQDAPPTLVVALKTGATEVYALAQKPVIRYTEETMTVSAEGVETSYELSQVMNFHFEGDLETTSVKAVEPANFAFRQTDRNVFCVSGSRGVEVFNTSGQKVKNYQAEGELSVDLNSLPAGVYVVLVKGEKKTQSIKILKK